MAYIKGVGKTRLVVLMLMGGLLVLLMTGTALAATPQEIYDDFAADGDLDGAYTDAELQAVLTDPTLAQYANPTTLGDLTDVINQSDADESEFPFTGAQMLLIGAVGIVLVGGGVFLRRGSKKTS